MDVEAIFASLASKDETGASKGTCRRDDDRPKQNDEEGEEEGEEPGIEIETQPQRPGTILERMKIYGLVVIFGGILAEMAVMGFLGYLWFQQQRLEEGRNESRLWRLIVMKSWMAPTITLSTVVLRSVVGAQLMVCTALVAGLVLETSSSTLDDAPRLSVMRAYNGGPRDLVHLIVRRLSKLSSFRISAPEGLGTLLFLFGLVLQFMSTLLVSDLGDTLINSDPDTQRLAIFDESGRFILANGDNLWSKSPATWSTFAEWRNKESRVSDNLADTGKILRAYFPLESIQRLSLRSYEGPALTQEVRTMCVPADLSGSIFNLYGASDMIMIEGSVSADLSAMEDTGFPLGDSGQVLMTSIPFGCPLYYKDSYDHLALGVKGDRTDSAMAICTIGYPGFSRFLLLHIEGRFLEWYNYVYGTAVFQSNTNGWAKYTPRSPASGMVSEHLNLSASICSVQYSYLIEPITASTSTQPREIPLAWDNATARWNTDDVLRLIGVVDDVDDADARGILRLSPPTVQRGSVAHREGPETLASMEEPFVRGLVPKVSGSVSIEPVNESLIFCTSCVLFPSVGNSSLGVLRVHPSNVLLTQASINATNNPAAALDVLWSSFTQTLYTSVVGQLDGVAAENSSMVWAVQVFAPTRWSGFFASAGLLAGHIAVVVVISVLFMVKTKYSFLGGTWQAIAQATTGNIVTELLEDVAVLPDRRVLKVMKSKGLENVRVGLEKDPGSGEVRMSQK